MNISTSSTERPGFDAITFLDTAQDRVYAAVAIQPGYTLTEGHPVFAEAAGNGKALNILAVLRCGTTDQSATWSLRVPMNHAGEDVRRQKRIVVYLTSASNNPRESLKTLRTHADSNPRTHAEDPCPLCTQGVWHRMCIFTGRMVIRSRCMAAILSRHFQGRLGPILQARQINTERTQRFPTAEALSTQRMPSRTLA